MFELYLIVGIPIGIWASIRYFSNRGARKIIKEFPDGFKKADSVEKISLAGLGFWTFLMHLGISIQIGLVSCLGWPIVIWMFKDK